MPRLASLRYVLLLGSSYAFMYGGMVRTLLLPALVCCVCMLSTLLLQRTQKRQYLERKHALCMAEEPSATMEQLRFLSSRVGGLHSKHRAHYLTASWHAASTCNQTRVWNSGVRVRRTHASFQCSQVPRVSERVWPYGALCDEVMSHGSSAWGDAVYGGAHRRILHT
jgi:hypothetical protein